MADTADRKPFRSDDDHQQADGPGGIDPLLELSQIAGFEPEADSEPDDRQIDLEDALLAELTPDDAHAPEADAGPEPVEPTDLPPFIGGGTDIDPVAPAADDISAEAMEAELSPPMPDPAPAMAAWPPHMAESAATAAATEPVEDIPAFLSTAEPEAAPAAPSLEDELAAMLAGDTAPAPAAETPGMDAQTASFDPMPEDAPEPEPYDASRADQVVADDAVPPMPIFDAQLDDVDNAAGTQAVAADWQDDADFGADAAAWPDAAETDPELEPHAGDAPPDLADLDEEFAAAFDEELSGDFGEDALVDPFAPSVSADTVPAADLPAEPQPLDPVDELAAIMGYEPPVDPVQPDAAPVDSSEDVERTLDAMDADFQSALDADLTGELPIADAGAPDPLAGLPAAAAPAPVMDTVDMSPFEGVPASDFDVPEFDHGDHAPAREPADPNTVFSDEFDRDIHAAQQSEDTARDAAAGAATATALAGAFDSEQFEAELARDMEFVGHDLNTERDTDGLDLDAAEESVAPEPAERSGRRGMVIGLVVAGLAIAGVTGVLALSDGNGTVDEGPVLVEADDTPVKIEPDDPGGTTVPNQDRAVFADGETAAPSQQNLVSTTEEPVDIAAAPADSLPAAVAVGEKAEDRLTEGGTETSASDAIAPITPRRVRTLIVRPDGTLEERAPEPVETVAAQPDAPETPVASAPEATQPAAPQTAPVVEAPQTVAGVPVTDVAEPAAPVVNDPVPEATADAASSTPAAPASQATAEAASEAAPVVVRRVQTTTATPPVIRDRPSDQPVNVVNRQQVAAAPAAAPAPAPQAAAPAQQAAVPVTTTSGSTGFSVQLAALPSEESARATATRLSQQYGNLIAGRGLTIQRAVIEGRGTFYRVRVAANGSGDANALCNSIKASGGNCFVAR
jgi:hypothetical protein